MKFGCGKSSLEMLRDVPTTVAPAARNRRVTNDPRPPLAPVMKTILSFISFRSPRHALLSHEMREGRRTKVSRGFEFRRGVVEPVALSDRDLQLHPIRPSGRDSPSDSP